VYVFRFDWRNGRIVTWEEYANPVTILRAFPELAPDA
jgi:ketosteroid isomerase-like protein